MSRETMPAMGRPFSLGYLYDKRTDSILNKSPWPQARGQWPRTEQPAGAFFRSLTKCSLSFTEGDLKILELRQDCTRSSLQEDKMISLEKDHFHIDLSIKVQFWAGPIPVTIGGSMLYEQSSESNLEKEGASFSFTETTATKMLSMDHFKYLFENMSAAEEIDSFLEGDEATHVISGENLSPPYLSQGSLTVLKLR